MPVRLPRLGATTAIVDGEARPTQAFTRYWQQFAEQIETTLNAITALPQIQQALADAAAAIGNAQAAAEAAQGAAEDAIAAQAATAREAALTASYIEPSSVLSADPAAITVAAHTRYYGDGTSVAVSGGSATATTPGDTDYVFYDDPMRAGGTVAYQVGTAAPVQTGDRHVIGAVTIPATGTVEGGAGPRPPGYVNPTPEP